MPEPVALLWALSTHAHLTVGNQSRGSLGGPRWGGAVVPQAEPLLPAPASGRPGMEWMCGLSQGRGAGRAGTTGQPLRRRVARQHNSGTGAGSGELGDRLTIARVRQACGAALRQAFEAGWQRALRRFSLGANNLFAFSKDVCFLGGH